MYIEYINMDKIVLSNILEYGLYKLEDIEQILKNIQEKEIKYGDEYKYNQN